MVSEAGASRLTVTKAVVLVVMGVSGSGKTTVARLVADRMGWPYQEGDDLHPKENVEKMASGQALTDEDRWPWLDLIADWIEERLDAGESAVVTCSALKRAYRERLNRRGEGVVFVHMAGSFELIAGRMAERKGHYMPTSLLQSQFDTLEEPGPDEPALHVSIEETPEMVADEVVRRLGLDSTP